MERRNIGAAPARDLTPYQFRPCEYAREVLHYRPTEVQDEILSRLHRPPYRTFAKAAHSVGKTSVAAVALSYWFDVFPLSSCVISTAPTKRDVEDLLWREVRLLRIRAGLGGFRGMRAPELWENEDHYAKGFTAEKIYVGRHLRHMLFILDEAVALDAAILTQLDTMFKPDGLHAMVAIGNPTDTSSPLYVEEQASGADGSPKWHTIEMSALDHPNITAALRGEPPPIPEAVSLAQLNEWLSSWAEPVSADEKEETDIEFPPGSGIWHRPGALFEGRVLGRWPSAGTYGVWSDGLWKSATKDRDRTPNPVILPQIGCDPARFGNNFTAIHVQWCGISLHHERHNGWDGPRIVGRLKQLANHYADEVTAARPPQAEPVKGQEIAVMIDSDGLGGLGVVDWGDGYRFIGVSGMGTPMNERDFFNQRTELWFLPAMMARKGLIDISGLPVADQQRLRTQAMAPRWKPNGRGQCQVESKEQTIARLDGKGSPDDMDAFNLSHWTPPDRAMKVIEQEKVEKTRAQERGLFGYGK